MSARAFACMHPAGSTMSVRGRCCVLGLSLLLALSGCAKYVARPLSPGQGAAELEARTLDDPKLKAFIDIALALDDRTEPPSSWDLTRLTLAALYYHPDLDIARARLASARARIVTARQVPNPLLSFGATYNTTTTVPSPWTVGPMIDFVVETFGRREYRTAEARQLAAAAREDLATATWLVRGRVRLAFLNLWIAQRRLVLTQRRQGLESELVSLLERRFAAGEASALEVARVRIDADQTSLAVREAEHRAADARTELAAAIGIPVEALARVSFSFEAFERPPQPDLDLALGRLRHEALLHRSDVQSLLAQYEAAEATLQLEVARQFPNLILSPGYTYDQGDNKYTIAFSAEVPVFNQSQGPIAEAEAHRRDAAARFVAVQAGIIAAIDRAAASYRSGVQASSTADALLTREQNRQQRTTRSFDAGEVGRPTLVTGALELVIVELLHFDALAQRLQALGTLEDALQEVLLEPGAPFVFSEVNPRDAREVAR